MDKINVDVAQELDSSPADGMPDPCLGVGGGCGSNPNQLSCVGYGCYHVDLPTTVPSHVGQSGVEGACAPVLTHNGTSWAECSVKQSVARGPMGP